MSHQFIGQAQCPIPQGTANAVVSNTTSAESSSVRKLRQAWEYVQSCMPKGLKCECDDKIIQIRLRRLERVLITAYATGCYSQHMIRHLASKAAKMTTTKYTSTYSGHKLAKQLRKLNRFCDAQLLKVMFGWDQCSVHPGYNADAVLAWPEARFDLGHISPMRLVGVETYCCGYKICRTGWGRDESNGVAKIPNAFTAWSLAACRVVALKYKRVQYDGEANLFAAAVKNVKWDINLELIDLREQLIIQSARRPPRMKRPRRSRLSFIAQQANEFCRRRILRDGGAILGSSATRSEAPIPHAPIQHSQTTVRTSAPAGHHDLGSSQGDFTGQPDKPIPQRIKLEISEHAAPGLAPVMGGVPNRPRGQVKGKTTLRQSPPDAANLQPTRDVHQSYADKYAKQTAWIGCKPPSFTLEWTTNGVMIKPYPTEQYSREQINWLDSRPDFIRMGYVSTTLRLEGLLPFAEA